jgi:hypothetical protein
MIQNEILRWPSRCQQSTGSWRMRPTTSLSGRQTHRDTYLEQQQTEKLETEVRVHRDTYLEQQQAEKLETEVRVHRDTYLEQRKTEKFET